MFVDLDLMDQPNYNICLISYLETEGKTFPRPFHVASSPCVYSHHLTLAEKCKNVCMLHDEIFETLFPVHSG